MGYGITLLVDGGMDFDREAPVGTCDDLCLKVEGAWRFAKRQIGRWNDKTAPWLFNPSP